MREAYEEQVRGLIDGGADLLLLETIFDTLNAKAAHRRDRERLRGEGRPPAADDLGDDHRQERPHALGPDARRVLHLDPPRASRSASASTARSAPATCVRTSPSSPRIAECYVSSYPNAGLPNAFGEYDELPDETGALLEDFAASGFANIVGGCCGTTPDHIAAIAQGGRRRGPDRCRPSSGSRQPRRSATPDPALRAPTSTTIHGSPASRP